MPSAESSRSVRADALIDTIAGRQHGVVSRAQLLHAGVTRDILDHRVATGRLRCVHRGVYQLGPLTSPAARFMAAVLACGAAAVSSGRSAAVLWQMLPPGDREAPVDVTLTRGRAGRRPGIRIHHVRTLGADEVGMHDGIPVTTAARTLLDLAADTPDRDLERALSDALARGLVQRRDIAAMLDRHARMRGAGRLRRLLADESRAGLTRSEAEERFVALVRRAGLRHPETNVRVAAGVEVDVLWRAERLVVEIDGYAYHSSAQRFERDRRRDAILVAAGLRVMRITWRQIVEEPEAVLVRVAQALVRT